MLDGILMDACYLLSFKRAPDARVVLYSSGAGGSESSCVFIEHPRTVDNHVKQQQCLSH